MRLCLQLGIFFLLIGLCTGARAERKKVFPDKASIPLHYVYTHVKDTDSPDKVSVQGLDADAEGSVTNARGKRTVLARSRLELERKWAASIFPAMTASGEARGTAFLIAENIVLTNKHLFEKNQDCGKFKVTVRTSKKFTQYFACDSVLFCGKGMDFCVVRLQESNDGHKIGEYAKPLPLKVEQVKEGEELTIIGNTMDYGISAASSHEHKYDMSMLAHYISTDHGASGSPVIDENGNVVALHFMGASKAQPSNYAIPIDLIAISILIPSN